MRTAFPDLVADDQCLEVAIREIHRILNRGKRFRKFHRIMKLLHSRGYEAGNYRETLQRGTDYLAPRPKDVPPLMRSFGKKLDQLMRNPINDEHARMVCGWTLAMMIRIHPFADGNGRTTRTLINLLLARAGHSTIDFPSDSDIYKRSSVWSGFKSHMRYVRAELGWSLKDGNIPPKGYYDHLRESLEREIATASIATLAARRDIGVIAEALAEVREDGFE
jgi:hypothetical protein